MEKRDNEIMKLLKVNQLRHPLGWTEKGEITKLIRKGEDKYTYMLDVVPLEDDISKKLDELFNS